MAGCRGDRWLRARSRARLSGEAGAAHHPVPAGRRDRRPFDKLAGETIRILNAPDVKERLLSQGGDAAGTTPEQFSAFIKSEISRWARMVKETGVKLE